MPPANGEAAAALTDHPEDPVIIESTPIDTEPAESVAVEESAEPEVIEPEVIGPEPEPETPSAPAAIASVHDATAEQLVEALTGYIQARVAADDETRKFSAVCKDICPASFRGKSVVFTDPKCFLNVGKTDDEKLDLEGQLRAICERIEKNDQEGEFIIISDQRRETA